MSHSTEAVAPHSPFTTINDLTASVSTDENGIASAGDQVIVSFTETGNFFAALSPEAAGLFLLHVNLATGGYNTRLAHEVAACMGVAVHNQIRKLHPELRSPRTAFHLGE